MSRYSNLFGWAAMIGVMATLSACGSGPDEPVEQIIVREPGQAPGTQAEKDPPKKNLQASGDLMAEGKAAFAVCSACHSAVKDAASTVGPNLYGVVGREAGSLADFPGYSEAVKNSGITWTEDELDAFIADSVKKIPGTTMASAPVSDPAKRTAIIAFLKASSE